MRDIKILRRSELKRRYGKAETALLGDIKAGLLPPAVHIGERAVGWPEHEVEAVLRARILGMDNDEIRALVARLVAERSKLADGLLKSEVGCAPAAAQARSRTKRRQ